jgi:outer membrane biogenesis lipoprotein LolB
VTTKFAYSISAISLILLSACSGPSSEELNEAQTHCKRFYGEKRAKSNEYVSAIDHWNKNGKLVIELAVKSYSDPSSYSSGLCVYDKQRGTVEIPGLFEQSRWHK